MKPHPTTLALLALAFAAATNTSAIGNDAYSYCSHLYGLVARYVIKPTSKSPSSVRLRAEVARADCDEGDHSPGIAELERLVRNAKLPMPDRQLGERG
jgi:hypothetical protein